ncbi:MAG: hypothetical protein WC717_00525 [Candidatus Micrarchaeia archaeon]|jgi:hypothetical protein
MAKENAEGGNGGASPKVIVFAAVVVIAAIVAIGFYSGFFGPAEPAQPSQTLPLATPEARLLLASFDKGAALEGYSIKYMENDNGALTNYSIASKGGEGWVSIEDDASRMAGFFSANSTSDIICLEYDGVEKCAMAGTDEKMNEIDSSLRIWLLNSTTYEDGKDGTRALIAVGAVRLAPGISEEKVGAFDTQKISYTLDYRNLTVQQLVSLGFSPSDAALSIVRDVTFWIDRKTGLVAKILMKEANGLGVYEREYTELSIGDVKLPGRNMTRVGAGAFVEFYTQSQEDYARREACLSLSGDDRDLCFRNNAVEKRSWEACKAISSRQIYESCSLIVAQITKNHAICGSLEALSDECYISVVGETGNAELCRNLKNSSLAPNCAQAAADGKRKADEAAAVAAKEYAGRNCAADADCKAFGNALQYCAPKNSTSQFASDSSPIYACLAGVPCGCMDGYCGFAKNETYYSCVGGVEEEILKEYIRSLIPNNSTAQNATGGP